MAKSLIFVINPGSTSTKIAVFEQDKQVWMASISHSPEEINAFPSIYSQFDYRYKSISDKMKDSGINAEDIAIVMGRGGLIRPVESGVLLVNEALKADLRDSPVGEHASNLGGLLAAAFADSFGSAKAYIADPVAADEFDALARISGHPLFERKSLYHPLNHKAVARQYASSISTTYEELNLIIAHMGGGITVGAHRKGRVVDTNNGLDGDGPFTPERSGTIPAGDLVRLCFSEKYTEQEILKMLTGKGGMVAYLNTSDARAVEEGFLNNEPKATLIYTAMAYQISKEIGAMFTVLKGEVDAIILTGGLAYSHVFTKMIAERIGKLGPVKVYPGEDEMRALAANGLNVLKGTAKIIEYQP
ncbi:MAG: butyrate kinase [Bacteroidales bacterium]|nr:butyrate kinase [Bacteroidales bacterium]